jgi:serine/threonine protein kinase
MWAGRVAAGGESSLFALERSPQGKGMQATGMQAKPAPTTNLLALPEGTELVGDFRIKRVLGAGGFGITYLADEKALARLVTIKEYFPAELAARQQNQSALPRSQDVAGDYQWGLDRFIDEAQTLARFDHPHIVRVHRYFRANNTAYMVLHFEEGGSFKSWLKGLKRAPRQAELDRMIAPLLDALEIIHKDNFLHRDIAPDNIMVRKDGSPVLIDFGSARGHIAAHSRTVSALVKPGYSPYEQYATTSSNQGPWTDIYALGATLYHAITGKRPPDAPSRVVDDEYVPAREAALGSYRSGFLGAVDQALKVEVGERPQSVAQWREALLAPEPQREPGRLGLRLPIARTLRRLRGVAAPEAAQPAPVEAARKAAARAAPEAAAPAPPDATLVLTDGPASLVPPPPDAPQPKGQLLDFIAALKRHRPPILAPGKKRRKGMRRAPAAPVPASPQAAAPAARRESLAQRLPAEPQFGLGYGPPPASTPAAPAREAKAEPKSAARAIPRLLMRRAPPKPRRAWRLPSRRWRSALVKVAAAVGIAGMAVAYQESMPRTVAKGAGVVASQGADLVAPVNLVGHQGPVIAATTSDEGRWIVSAGSDGTLRVWNAGSGALVRTIEIDEGAATALAVDDQRALTGHKGGTTVLWDLERAEKLATFQHGSSAITALAFTDDNSFAAAAKEGSVALFDIRAPTTPAVLLDGRESAGTMVAAAHTGGLLATAGNDTVRLWRAPAATLARSYRSSGGDVIALDISADGRALAAVAADGSVRIWRSSSSRAVRVIRAREGGRVSALAFGPEGMLAVAGDDGRVKLWNLRSGRIVRSLGAGPLRALSFSPDGRRLIGAGQDGVIRVWFLAAVPGPGGKQGL